jgi:hypothetical protein
MKVFDLETRLIEFASRIMNMAVGICPKPIAPGISHHKLFDSPLLLP